jgi:hypothetical protein
MFVADVLSGNDMELGAVLNRQMAKFVAEAPILLA